ncbi:sensor histidine kinase [Bacillus sp. B15-48]|uniref:ATP-binding protein n=1 Tax=Bacillus sp. B15-48 TaxID=1548601 RepID=UPI00193F06DC|nr:sensor histidine kinase [Bacillus sp. B15-48]MBM4764642.1 GHKL domain-containing protein [Bacillus sp. B15-48]
MFRMKIQTKLTILILFIVSFSLFVSGFVVITHFIHAKEQELKQQSLVAARTVAGLSEISNSLSDKDSNPLTINHIVEPIRVTHNADYIIVLDMDRVRYSHPVPSMIGKISKGSDENQAFAEHTYTTKARGEAGTAIRAFAPIVNNERQQVGVVIAGFLLPTFYEVLASLKSEILLTTVLSLLFGGWGALLLAQHIKKQLFHLEPDEIAKMLVERNETFNAMQEGYVAIDANERITIFNHKAKELFALNGEVIGKNIREVYPESMLPNVMQSKTPFFNKEIPVQNLIFLSSHLPIKVNNEVVGAVAIFQDLTEMKNLAEELTGVKAFVSALRVQNHEYINKLHAIAGLIQLGNKETALNYVLEETDEQTELTRFLSKNIKNDSISGLLLSKVSRGKELGIMVTINRRSMLTSFPKGLDHHDFVVILGNLIENAFDAFQTIDHDEKEIFVSIEQTEDTLTILVEDNGCGISPEYLCNIFTEGFSTKHGQNHGIGLYLVKQIINNGNGVMDVESSLGEGTTFTITFER